MKISGTHSEAKHYCIKPVPGCNCIHCAPNPIRLQGPWTYGDDTDIPEGQGSRTDLTVIKRKLDEGQTMATIADEHFSSFIRYHNSFREYKKLRLGVRQHEMEIIVLIGATAVGKTQWSYHNYPDLYSVPPPKQSGCYWDGYESQETVLVDEMYGNRFSHGFLLQLCDRYPFQVPYHGGQMSFTSHRLIFCSNSHPDTWYDQNKFPFQGGPLQRRFTQGMSRICLVDVDGVQVIQGYELALIAPVNQ